jgi:hypothetical protein
MVVHDTATNDDLTALKIDLKADIVALKADIIALEQRLMSVVENQTLRVTVRLGIMLAAGFSLMTAILKFH